jgi:hypothetical protein
MKRRDFNLTTLLGLAGLSLLPQFGRADTKEIDLGSITPSPVTNLDELQMALSNVLSENIFELDNEETRRKVSNGFNTLLNHAMKQRIIYDYSFQDLENDTLDLYIKKTPNGNFYHWQFTCAIAESI